MIFSLFSFLLVKTGWQLPSSVHVGLESPEVCVCVCVHVCFSGYMNIANCQSLPNEYLRSVRFLYLIIPQIHMYVNMFLHAQTKDIIPLNKIYFLIYSEMRSISDGNIYNLESVHTLNHVSFIFLFLLPINLLPLILHLHIPPSAYLLYRLRCL